jgi:hypothetical protein
MLDTLKQLLAQQYEASLSALNLSLRLRIDANIDVPWVSHAWTDA